MGRVRGHRPRHLVCSQSVAGWGEFGVADPGVLEHNRSVAGWSEFGVANPSVLERSQSVAGWGEFRVADLGVLCLEPPSPVGL